MLDVVKIAPVYHNELFDKIQYTVEIVTNNFPNHTAVSVRRMCAKLQYDLLNNIVKPIERNQTAAKLKVNLKKLLTKCARHKLMHKNPRLQVIKRTPKANSVADGTDERPSAGRMAEIKLAVANGHKMPIAKPPPGVLQGFVIPGSHRISK